MSFGGYPAEVGEGGPSTSSQHRSTPQQSTSALLGSTHFSKQHQHSQRDLVEENEIEFDELNSDESSQGPGSVRIQIIDDDDDDSEEDVPLARTHSISQQQQALLTAPGSSAGPSTSRKRARTTGWDYPYDGSIRDAAEFLAVNLPRYTLVTAEGTKTGPHVIKLAPGVTDGIASRCPPVGTLHINEGTLHAAPDLEQAWCLSIGGRVARLLGLPGSGKGEDTFRLESLPARYALYRNVKTTPPTRKDPYLWGPPRTNRSVRYRSAPELAPHVYWLLTAGEGDQHKECACRYCTGRSSQIEINRELGLQDSQVYHTATRHYVHRSKPNAPRQPKRASSPPVVYLGPFTSALRDKDLAPGASPFRHSELVWVELDQPLTYPTGEADFTITHWPGLICEREIRIQQTPAGNPAPESGADAPALEPPEQRSVFRIQLLGLEDIVLAEEWSLAPWMGLSSAALNFDDFQVPTSSSLVFDGEAVLVPRLINFDGNSQLAMVAFALATSIGANIDIKFAAIDPYVSPNAGLNVKKEGEAEGDGAKAVEYQSIWWGAEQLHSEELVRVLVTPEELEHATGASLPDEVHEHALLFKLSTIFHQPGEDGTEPILKMAGTFVGLEKTAVKVEDGAEEKDSTADLDLPAPPKGYKWRRLRPAGETSIRELEDLAGRYYPLPDRLDGHADRLALVMNDFKELQAKAAEAEKLGEEVECNYPEDQLALILAGLLPAKLKYAQARYWAEDRFRMICQAESTTNDEVREYLAELARQAVEGEGEGAGVEVEAAEGQGGMEVEAA